MLILKIDPEENGAHANQTIYGRLSRIPEGWSEIPEKLEQTVRGWLPWVKTAEDGSIAENAEAREAWAAAIAAAQVARQAAESGAAEQGGGE